MFTVRRLRLSASLERTLTPTNPVESERDLHRADYPAQRQALEGRGDAPALDRRPECRCLADTPPRVSPRLFAVTAEH
jgi:hypothetical protein